MVKSLNYEWLISNYIGRENNRFFSSGIITRLLLSNTNQPSSSVLRSFYSLCFKLNILRLNFFTLNMANILINGNETFQTNKRTSSYFCSNIRYYEMTDKNIENVWIDEKTSNHSFFTSYDTFCVLAYHFNFEKRVEKLVSTKI